MSFINVITDYGAVGDGTHNDQPNIQNAFDAAFKTGGVPNGRANWRNNRPVYFPPGKTYLIGSTLNLTQVYRGLIIGGFLVWGGGTRNPILSINGMEECRFERFAVTGAYPNLSSSRVFTIPSPNTIRISGGHGYSVGKILKSITTDGSFPTGLVANTTPYFVKSVVNSTDFTVSLYVGGPTVTFSGAGTGTHSINPSDGAIGVDLDWDGDTTYGVQLRNNLFKDANWGACETAIKIAKSGLDGSGNQFVALRALNSGIGYQIIGSAATDNVLWAQAAGGDSAVGVQCDGGSFILHGTSTSTNRTAHCVISSPTPCLAAGGRFEVGVMCYINSGATFRCAGVTSDYIAYLNGGTLIADASSMGLIQGNGTGPFTCDGTGTLVTRATRWGGSGIGPGITVTENL